MPAVKDERARVEAYLARVAPDMRATLGRLRRQIRSLAPKATETISYGIPTFKLDGKPLVYFAAFKHHMSLFPVFASDLEGYEDLEYSKSGKGTLRFTVERPLPAAFVTRFVKGRARAIVSAKNPAKKPAKRRGP